MGSPLNQDPTIVQPEPEPEQPVQEEVTQDSEAKDNEKFLVFTPWYIDSLQGGGKFPDLNPQGVVLTGKERAAAYEGAREAGVTLRSQEAPKEVKK